MEDKKSRIALLFSEIQRGSKSAFDELFLLYYGRLYAFARQYTKQPESAEEITSELFCKIWISREGLAKVSNPETYLFIAVRNACLNLIRAEKKRELVFIKQPDIQTLEQPVKNYITALEENELEGIIDQAVAALPGQRRIIFKLIKEEGLKSKTVAEILNISVRTVENQLYKAVKAIADVVSIYLGYHPQTKISRKQAPSDRPPLFFF